MDILSAMDAARALRDARLRAGLTQAELAARGGTSQATVSAYEAGRKQPSLATLGRLLQAAGARLAVEPAPLARNARTFEQVLGLAEALPVRHELALRFPRLAA